MFNQWSLNKTESISLTYDAIREANGTLSGPIHSAEGSALLCWPA